MIHSPTEQVEQLVKQQKEWTGNVILSFDLSGCTVDLPLKDWFFFFQVQEFGLSEIRDLIPNGRHIAVTEENKKEYVKLVCQMKMTGAIRKQIDSFLEGFYDIIPKRLISIFDEQELELLISGLPNIDLEDLKANTEYHKYTESSLQVCYDSFYKLLIRAKVILLRQQRIQRRDTRAGVETDCLHVCPSICLSDWLISVRLDQKLWPQINNKALSTTYTTHSSLY